MRTKAVVVVCLVASLVALPGCIDTHQDVIEEYAARYRDVRQKLAALAGELPRKGSVKDATTCPTLDPPLVLNPGDTSCNTAFLMSQHLVDPDNYPDTVIDKGCWLLEALRWTGPKNPMSEMERDYYATSEFKTQLDKALTYRYAVVVRTVKIDWPTYEKFQESLDVDPLATAGVEAESRPKGYALFEVFVFDIEKGELLGSNRLQAITPDELEETRQTFTYENRQAFNDHAGNLLMMDIDTQLSPMLRELTGGEVVLKPLVQ